MEDILTMRRGSRAGYVGSMKCWAFRAGGGKKTSWSLRTDREVVCTARIVGGRATIRPGPIWKSGLEV